MVGGEAGLLALPGVPFWLGHRHGGGEELLGDRNGRPNFLGGVAYHRHRGAVGERLKKVLSELRGGKDNSPLVNAFASSQNMLPGKLCGEAAVDYVIANCWFELAVD